MVVMGFYPSDCVFVCVHAACVRERVWVRACVRSRHTSICMDIGMYTIQIVVAISWLFFGVYVFVFFGGGLA